MEGFVQPSIFYDQFTTQGRRGCRSLSHMSAVACFAKGHIKEQPFAPSANLKFLHAIRTFLASCGRKPQCPRRHTERNQTQGLNPQPTFCEGPAPTTAPLCHPGLIHFYFSTTFYFLTHSRELKCMSSSVREVLEPLVFHASLSSIV